MNFRFSIESVTRDLADACLAIWL